MANFFVGQMATHTLEQMFWQPPGIYRKCSKSLFKVCFRSLEFIGKKLHPKSFFDLKERKEKKKREAEGKSSKLDTWEWISSYETLGVQSCNYFMMHL